MAISLADAVLPPMRTRADLHRYSSASRHGRQDARGDRHPGVGRPDDGPGRVLLGDAPGVASAIKVIARADDSAGIIGHACRRLLALHPRAAASARVPAARLVSWMMKFQFDGDVDFFELDPVGYAPALGERGTAAYRAKLDEVRATLSPDPGDWLAADPDRHARWVLQWNDRRLAVLDRDVEAIVRTHARDRKVAMRFQDTAEALAEIGEIDLAIDWAHQGLEIGPGHQSLQAAEYWCTLLGEHRPADAIDARLTVFRRWPSSTTAARLHRATGSQWGSYADEVLATLSARPNEAVLFTLMSLKDVTGAWDLAHSLELDDDRTWAELIKGYEKVDPTATLPIHRRLVDHELVNAGASQHGDWR